MNKIVWRIFFPFLLLIAFYLGNHAPLPHNLVNVYQSEDLSDTPYLTLTNHLIVTRSAGWVCYANTRGERDENQLYVSCNAFLKAGGHIGG